MAFAKVQSNHASSSTPATSRALAYTSNLTAANLLVLEIYFESATETVSSITDTLSQTWVAIGALQRSGNNTSGQLYYVKNSGGGANTVTVNYSGAVINGLAIYEYSGGDTTSPLRGHAEAIGGSANPSSGTLNVAPVTNDLLVGYCIANITPTVGSGYTLQEQNFGWNDTAQSEDKIAASEPSIDWANASASTWAAFGAAFKPAAGGGGRVLTVGPTGDYTTIQAAVNASIAGDTIKCKAGTLFTEGVLLPNKGVLAAYITITSDANPANLPAPGVRMDPSYAAFLPKVQPPNAGSAAFTVAKSANHYRLQCIECPEVPLGFRAIIEIGAADSSQQFESDQPDSIVIDQCWVHGGVVCGEHRGIECNGTNITISNSYISDIKSVGQDSQAIGSLNGTGPLTVTNNFISCGSYSFMSGGTDPWIRTLMTTTGTPTTTSANVTCSEAGHTIAELTIGHLLAVRVGGTVVFTTLTSVSGSGASGVIGFTALTAPPDVPGGINAGAVLRGFTFRKNYVRNDPTWRLGAMPPVAGVGAVPSTASGSLAAGTWYYTVQAFSTAGYQGQTVHGAESDEVSAVLGAIGNITVSWTALTGATSYRLWRGTTPGARTQFVTVTGATTKVDDGTLSWTTATPTAGTVLDIKNIFEMKACIDGQIDSNIFENHWRGSDSGFAVWCKSANQEGKQTFAECRNITFEKNILRHVDGFLNAHAQEIPQGSGFGLPSPVTNATFRNNLIFDSGTEPWKQGSDHYAMSLQGGLVNCTIDHNTLVHVTSGSGGGLIVTESAEPHPTNLVLTNNLFRAEAFGIHDSLGTGKAALDIAAPGYTFAKNAVADATTPTYPTNNFYEVAALWEAEFVTYAVDGVGADFHIKPTSQLHNAGLDGKDVGADIDLVLAATADVVSGIPGSGSLHRRHGRW